MHRAPRNGRAVYWMAAGVCAIILAFIVGSCSHKAGNADTFPSATPSMRVSAPSVTVSPSTSATATPSTSAMPGTTQRPKPTPTPEISIDSSMPVEVYVPSIDMRLVIHPNTCPIVDGKIDPDRSDYMVACVVKGDNLASQLPGTHTANTTMIVGHTWRAKPTWHDSVSYAAFNALYDWETNQYTVKVGAEIWVRTQASGRRWLVYKVTGFSQPTKTVGNDDLWDFADMPAPNTLKLVGCQQPTDYNVRHSTNNIVVKAVFVRVQG